MTFKNKRGEVHWYVIGLIIAVLVLLVSISIIYKIKKAQDSTDDAKETGCTVLGGECKPGTSCGTQTEVSVAKAACGEGKVCCEKAITPPAPPP